jgi:hypothetical protein
MYSQRLLRSRPKKSGGFQHRILQRFAVDTMFGNTKL